MDEFKKELEDYFCRFTFGQFVTLILIEIVTLFFVFYLGARYGPDLIGSGATTRKEESLLPKQGPKSVDDIVGSPNVEYTYPEVLTSRDGQKAIRIKPSGVTASEYEQQKLKEEVRAPIREEGWPAPTALIPKPVVRNVPVEEAAPVERTEEPEQPVQAVVQEAPKKETPKPVAPPAAQKPKGKFAIQVGAYQSAEDANTSLNHWRKKGYSAFLAVGQVPQKGTWYRVRVGGFGTRDEALKFMEKLKAKEKVSALVVLSSS